MNPQVCLASLDPTSASRKGLGSGRHWDWPGFATALLCSSGLVATAQEVPCFVDSTHDGNGFFSYTFRRGNAPYVWGLDTWPASGIGIQSYGILEVVSPPGWTNSVTPGGWITWSVTDEIRFLDEPATFSIRSSLAEAVAYDHGGTGPYPRGVIVGSVYELPGRTNQLGGGYQNFNLIGPALPALVIEQTEQDIVLRWSTLAQGCQLQTADELTLPAVWKPVTNLPVVKEANFVVNLPRTATAQWFRLTTPAVQIP